MLKTSGVRLTGRKRRLLSPLTNQITTYHETYGIYVTSPAPVTPNIDAVRDRIDNDLLSQSVDGFCDEILVIQGVVQDTYKPRVWIAEDQPTLQAKYGILIAGTILAIIICIAIIAVAIAAVVIVNILANSFMTISQYILQPPKYVGGTPDNPEVYDTWAEYLSSQHNLYWYVCPKCGAGFGSKLDYPSIDDVPESEVDAFNEHRDFCLGIPTGPQHIGEFLMFAAIGVAGLAVGGYILVSLIRRRKEAERLIVVK